LTVPEQWLEKAKYDIETAGAMLKAGRYFYVLFCCQQAVEKSLKAIIAEKTRKLPPRVHNLVALAQTAGVVAEEKQTELMRLLTEFYVDSRYPEIRGVGVGDIDRMKAEDCLNRTVEMVQWLTTFRKT
jgi:HEPN domain-containing protein